MSLTKEQKQAFKYIKQKDNIFITSRGAGCGKTYLLNAIIKKYKNNLGNKLAVTASTGISAILIKGQTLHSWAGIGLGKEKSIKLIEKIRNNEYKLKNWLEVEMLIIDEISLISAKLFDKLDNIAKALRKNDRPFGGIQVIVSGDWLQLPNINNSKYTFESKKWNKIINKVVYLTKIIRQNEPIFQRILNSIRVGRITNEVKKVLRSRNNLKDYNELGIIPTKLYSLNVNVDKINNKELSKIAKMTHNKIYSYKLKWKSQITDYTPFLKSITAIEQLDICKGTQVILVTNLEKDLVNGLKGIVINFSMDGLPIVKFINGIIKTIEYKNWEIEDIDGELIGHFRQIPLKLGYATTIHKSQGSTLSCIEIDLGNIFESSQAYVGLSRVISLDGLFIKNLDFTKFYVNKRALNYYKKLEKNIHKSDKISTK